MCEARLLNILYTHTCAQDEAKGDMEGKGYARARARVRAGCKRVRVRVRVIRS